jgi:phenylalanyl-tRNA synthetase beta chain
MRIEIEGKDAGLICELHPETVKNFEITGKAAIFDLDLDAMFNAEKRPVKFKELQKFPEVPFELSVLADKNIYSEDILKTVSRSDQNRIKDVSVVSIYQGAQIPESKKSVSIKVISRLRKTLEPAEIDELQKGNADLQKAGYTLR